MEKTANRHRNALVGPPSRRSRLLSKDCSLSAAPRACLPLPIPSNPTRNKSRRFHKTAIYCSLSFHQKHPDPESCEKSSPSHLRSTNPPRNSRDNTSTTKLAHND